MRCTQSDNDPPPPRAFHPGPTVNRRLPGCLHHRDVLRQPRSLVVVCHLAVQRCLFAYFMGVAVSEVPYIDLPLHHLTELIPSPFGTGCKQISEGEMMHHF